MIKLFEDKIVGFSGKLLKIDLSVQRYSEEIINTEYINQFLGGAGYACRYLLDHIKKETDPLSAENILVIMNGPFTLTNAPLSSKSLTISESFRRMAGNRGVRPPLSSAFTSKGLSCSSDPTFSISPSATFRWIS